VDEYITCIFISCYFVYDFWPPLAPNLGDAIEVGAPSSGYQLTAKKLSASGPRFSIGSPFLHMQLTAES